ncbi:MAG: UDP-N-acetylmuramoyl-L-alanine--D-glutamate ligase [Tannerella sp.]|jgi:UDP-N-acetylmuramoylalanine--D-glutamate ligase|nr:UDP-N-acetylmuramoyl-L-alanine--D-glutamate ligase [Tannerella sp.]
MNRRTVILGAGESGTGAAILAKARGADVFVSDSAAIRPPYRDMLTQRGIAWEENGHTETLILNADEIVKSPGIPERASVMRQVAARGIPVISEIELAGRHTDAKMICITGSNGKTTTTMLTHHILSRAGLDAGLAGNVGRSLALQVAEEPHDCYVVELSSFQLDNMYDFRADVAILLNITPDHLDRYGHDLQNYADAKFRILRNQTEKEAFVFWNDDPFIARELSLRSPPSALYPFSDRYHPSLKGYLSADGKMIIETFNGIFDMERKSLSLKGTHNLYNSMAAGIAASILDIRNEKIRESLSDFAGVEHRLETVARVRGVDYINDSKATNVNSCWYALQSVPAKLVLILGGTDKGNDYSEIEALVMKKVRALVFLGADNSKLHGFFDGKGLPVADARSMEEAVNAAGRLARKGDTVLLSPCCASFDLFENYEDRGNRFKACVLNL